MWRRGPWKEWRDRRLGDGARSTMKSWSLVGKAGVPPRFLIAVPPILHGFTVHQSGVAARANQRSGHHEVMKSGGEGRRSSKIHDPSPSDLSWLHGSPSAAWPLARTSARGTMKSWSLVGKAGVPPRFLIAVHPLLHVFTVHRSGVVARANQRSGHHEVLKCGGEDRRSSRIHDCSPSDPSWLHGSPVRRGGSRKPALGAP
jgi:hypothetical protein